MVIGNFASEQAMDRRQIIMEVWWRVKNGIKDEGHSVIVRKVASHECNFRRLTKKNVHCVFFF